MNREVCVVTINMAKMCDLCDDLGDGDVLVKAIASIMNPTDWESITEEDYQILKEGEEQYGDILVLERTPLEEILPRCIRDYRDRVVEKHRVANEKRIQQERALEAKRAAAEAKKQAALKVKEEKAMKEKQKKEEEERLLFEKLKAKFGE